MLRMTKIHAPEKYHENEIKVCLNSIK